MTTNEKVARRKLSLLDLAKAITSQLLGYSRQQFYEIRRNYQTYGAEGLLERFSPEFRERQIEVHYPGELVAVDACSRVLVRCISKPCWTVIAARLEEGSTQASCRCSRYMCSTQRNGAAFFETYEARVYTIRRTTGASSVGALAIILVSGYIELFWMNISVSRRNRPSMSRWHRCRRTCMATTHGCHIRAG